MEEIGMECTAYKRPRTALDGGSAAAWRMCQVARAAAGGKDQQSKVVTVWGLRDRRVQLSVPTAIQFYDSQDRLNVDQPSKAIKWLIRTAIDELPSLDCSFTLPGTDAASSPPAAGDNVEVSTSETNKSSVLSLANAPPALLLIPTLALAAVATGSHRPCTASSQGGELGRPCAPAAKGARPRGPARWRQPAARAGREALRTRVAGSLGRSRPRPGRPRAPAAGGEWGEPGRPRMSAAKRPDQGGSATGGRQWREERKRWSERERPVVHTVYGAAHHFRLQPGKDSSSMPPVSIDFVKNLPAEAGRMSFLWTK
uniref:TCP domain-containing protein n=1 Tax=Setaria viridis TaxID=4556 RepID=A0A4U6WE89_SETVI|nr:LOW QUALITY PROTEIN: hypothetical protein SEVIR_1G234700v2 [Setaria viridis]